MLAALQSISSRKLVLRQVPIRHAAADGSDETVGYVDLVSERAYRYKSSGASDLIEMPAEILPRESEARREMLETLSEFDDKLLEQLIEDIAPEKSLIYRDLHDEFGADQIAWLKKDVAGLPSSTPIVLFAHVPLWTVYPEWGWGTDDSQQALDLLKRFGSVTVLNGHIHQIMHKVEGNVSFHTAMSTAFPQPTPGTAPAPGPMKVEPERLKSVLGITNVTFIPGRGSLAVVDATLSGEPPAFESASHDAMMRRQASRKNLTLAASEIGIDNFNFTPSPLTVKAGTTVTWINSDDVPHLIVWGDFRDKVAVWQKLPIAPTKYRDALVAAGGKADVFDLPSMGIKGNTHMMMMDRNSDEVAKLIHNWIARQGLVN